MEQSLSFAELDRMLGNYSPLLVSLSDGLEGELRIIIAAAELGEISDKIPDIIGGDAVTRQTLRGILANAQPIELNENRLYELLFGDYIIYQIRNESFCSYDPEEMCDGKHLMIFEKSKLLSHLSVATDARQLDGGSFYPGEWKHYGIYTQDHIIDVISHCPPDISRYIKQNP